MDYELLLNQSKNKTKSKNEKKNIDSEFKRIVEVINNIHGGEKLDETITDLFKNFIICYHKLNKNLIKENNKHKMIKTIAKDVVDNTLSTIKLISENSTNSQIKKINNCIIEENKTTKINIKKL